MIKSLRSYLRVVIGLFASLPIIAQNQVSTGTAIVLVTNVAQISRVSSQNANTSYFIQLEGEILWANPAAGKFVLKDSSGAEEFEMDLQGRSLQPGQRIRLEGNTTITARGASYQLGTIGPVVDDDGIHIMTEKSGAIYLNAGLHPICADWFNGLEKYGLEVDCEGPSFLRQRIPDAMLFRSQTNTDKTVSFIHGLNYACYPAEEEVLPDFHQLAALETGVVSNFDLSVMVRSEHIGLEFTGYLQIPRDGLYTFFLTSDDGSRLFIGAKLPALEIIGSAELPTPQQMVVGQVLSEYKDYQRVQVDGKITFVSEGKNEWELDLVSETGRLRLEMPGGSLLVPANLLNKQVHVIGICQSAYDADGEKVGGVLLVPNEDAIRVIKINEPAISAVEMPSTNLPALTSASEVHELSREEAARGYPVKISGVITCVLPERQAFIVQDATRGIYVVDSSESRSIAPNIGEYLEIEGRTDPSLFAPVVLADHVKDMGTGYMPQPIQPAWDQLLNGSLDAQYVELRGVITTIDTNGLTLFTGNGPIKVELKVVGIKSSELEQYEDSVIRVRGCLLASWDYVTHLVKVGDIRLYGAEVSVDQPAPDEMFSLPQKKVAELLEFNPQASVFQRVKVSGAVTYAQAPEYYLMDEKNGLQFKAGYS
jgi:hypothetical protein